ncbi:MAG TPA: ABC transporter substrate-binding protein [Chloroflexota bacterium]|nr:ABC transporter substrate-binding protein [Chloroflexota bacterium]
MMRTVFALVPILLIAAAACSGRGSAAGGGSQSAPASTGDATSSQSPAQHATLKVAYVPVLAFAPLYRAIAKGYFSAVGIDVDLTVVQSASDVVAFLGTGQMDVGLGNVGAPFYNAVNRGLEVRVVAGNSENQRDPATLVAAPLLIRRQLADDGSVRSPSDLRGRKVAINAPAGIQEYSLSKLLAASQLALSDVDVQYVPFPDMLAGLNNGAIDAAMLPEPFSAKAREQGVASVLVANPAPGATVTAVLFGTNLLKSDAVQTGRAFLSAMRKAANELQSEGEIFSDENLAIWAQYTGVAPDDIRKGAPYAYARDLALDPQSLTDQQRFLLGEGRLDFTEPLPVNRIVDDRFSSAG